LFAFAFCSALPLHHKIASLNIIFIKFEAWMLRKDCLSGMTFQSAFVNKNNYLISIGFCLEAAFFAYLFWLLKKGMVAEWGNL
ncbi:hypothetical protein KO505_11015, partial [Psychrosphaera sp. F3M07]|uniref:hypothetical protein n=1 Tax=Psychrosphaera sp. F3M07 TaxID=2841560 RepID=UPI001C0908AD